MKPSLLSGLILTIFLGSCATAPTDQSVETPNVLFLAVDDLRPELGCYGASHIHSPHIDQLAAEGTRLDRSYCNIPVCGASRASLLSGLRPARERFLTYFTRSDEDAPGVLTLPEHFRNKGYTTISNGKIYHHADDAGRSWDEVWNPTSSSKSWRDYALEEHALMDQSGDKRGPAFERAVLHDTAYKDGKIAEKVISDLQKFKESGKPFFLTAGFLKPHLPFNAPEKYWALYDGKVTLPENNYPPRNAPRKAMHNSGELRAYADIPAEGPVSDEMATDLIHGYYACVSYTDAQIGKIMAELKRLELDRNTIVILWGDHGWNLREHGLWCKHCNFETSLHTPLIVKVPGMEQVKASSQIVEYVDIYPTLCELAGLDLPGHLEGASFASLLSDPEATTDGVAVCQWYEGVTTIRDSWFYTEWIDDADSAYTRMLYDHRTDPGENVNISEEEAHAGIIENLSAEMRRSRAPNYFD